MRTVYVFSSMFTPHTCGIQLERGRERERERGIEIGRGRQEIQGGRERENSSDTVH